LKGQIKSWRYLKKGTKKKRKRNCKGRKNRGGKWSKRKTKRKNLSGSITPSSTSRTSTSPGNKPEEEKRKRKRNDHYIQSPSFHLSIDYQPHQSSF
jgi:hypothetical protein